MKAQYMVKKIDCSTCETPDDYFKLVKKTNYVFCNGLDDLRMYCGGKLHRQRGGGYSGMNGNIEYVAIRVK